MKEEVTKSGVCEQSSLTVPVNQEAEDLADEIIGGVSKISTILGKIALLKKMFNDGDRDGNNRLKVPIKSCYTWQEFCNRWLDRDIRTIQKQLAALNPKSPTEKIERTTMTAGEKAAYELGVTKTLAGQAFSNGTDVQLLSDYSVPKVANRLVTINSGTLQKVASPQDRDMIARSIISELQKFLLPTEPQPQTEPPTKTKIESPAGQVHFDELPPKVRAEVMSKINSKPMTAPDSKPSCNYDSEIVVGHDEDGEEILKMVHCSNAVTHIVTDGDFRDYVCDSHLDCGTAFHCGEYTVTDLNGVPVQTAVNS
jgi:hypothetical protein